MSVTIFINENQKRLILNESFSDDFANAIKNNYEFTKKVLKEASEQTGANFEFLITWGASIGGFIGPLEDYIRGREVSINEVQLSLILTGVIASYYIDNKETINKIISKIKEEGLMNAYKAATKKAGQLKTAFFDFISSLGLTLHKVTNIMGYTFVIPLIPMIYNISIGGNPDKITISHLVKRIVAFGLLTISGIILRELITKMIKRFKSGK